MNLSPRVAVVLSLVSVVMAGLAVAAPPATPPAKKVVDIKLADISATASSGYKMMVFVENVGNQPIQATLRMKVSVEGIGVVATGTFPYSLAPGQTFGYGVLPDPGYVLKGANRVVTAQIDVDNVLPELNKANNTLTKTMSGMMLSSAADAGAIPAVAVPKPDLVVGKIRSVVVQEGDDANGHYVIFNAFVTVRNVGAGAAGPFDVRLEHKRSDSGYETCPTCKIHVAGLAAGQNLELPPRQFNKRGTLTSGELIYFRATADCDSVLSESSESNNQYTTSCPEWPGHR